jgi:hypothetical protein
VGELVAAYLVVLAGVDAGSIVVPVFAGGGSNNPTVWRNCPTRR